tara:strand:- start:779 stop:2560 length:1782 start_codon:yes stop_codon:yes gene_type:complete
MQELRPRITVIGVGGAGCNAVNNMIDANLEGVDFLVANTDGQSLAHSMASRKIQLGTSLTGGLGAGSKPEMGRKAAEESLDEVLAELADSHMVFITAGMGGGTGTGAAPVIARAAKERGILTVGVITKPFDFEGKRRMEQADAGVEALQAYVDTLIVIPNQNLFRLANERTTLADTFHMADAVLHQGVCGVTDLMIKPGLINLDFADIRAVMSEMGKAMMGTGEASGETRAIEAAESAINNPLLDDSSMKGAKAVLINITGGMDMTLFEVDEAANRIREEVDPDATIIFGSAFEEKLEGVMRVSVVATGIDALSISTPLPLKGTADTDSAGASNEIMSSEKVKQVINFGHLAPASIPPTYDLSATEDTKNTSEEVDPQSTQTASLEQQIKPEQHTVEAADDPGSCRSKQEDNYMIPEHEQLDLETAANQAKTIARVEDEGPEENISTESNAFAKRSQRSKAATHQQAAIIRRPVYIPAASKDVGTDDEVVGAATEATTRPGLLNRFTGIWSSKPTDNSAAAQLSAMQKKDKLAEKTEPVLNRIDVTLPNVEEPVIMDLPAVEVVQPSLPVTTANPDDEDDDLDIPAFLRRQAN